MAERLQKVMANAGVASRRASEKLILAGKVMVNGQVVTELGTKVTGADVILVNGQAIDQEKRLTISFISPAESFPQWVMIRAGK